MRAHVGEQEADKMSWTQLAKACKSIDLQERSHGAFGGEECVSILDLIFDKSKKTRAQKKMR